MVAVWGRCTTQISILRAVYKALMKVFDSIGKRRTGMRFKGLIGFTKEIINLKTRNPTT